MLVGTSKLYKQWGQPYKTNVTMTLSAPVVAREHTKSERGLNVAAVGRFKKVTSNALGP